MAPVETTVIIPVLNEEHFIERCLESILNTTYNKNSLEIIVVDGLSHDSTIGKLNSINWQGVKHKILLNPKKIVPSALNLAIKEASGIYIIRMDAHTIYHSTYIPECLNALTHTGAANVGGPMQIHSTTPLDFAIEFATSSRFGIGNSTFHFPDKEGFVDTVYLGAFKKEIFDKIGYFDEELIRNQDDELNLRIIRAQEKIYLTPRIKSTYFPRSTLKKLFSQYYQYGFWKVRVIQKHKMVSSYRHLVPSIFVVYMAASLIFIRKNPVRFIFIGVLLTYSLGILSIIKKSWKCPKLTWILIPFVVLILHISYGLGFLHGFFHFMLKNRK